MFGASVAVSGNTAVVGAQWQGASPSWPGAAYVFGSAASPTPAPTPTPGGDTVGPVCAAKNATVRRNGSVSYYFRVYDALSAEVSKQVAVTTQSGAVKKRWTAGYGDNYDGWWVVKYACRLAKGRSICCCTRVRR